MHPVDVLQQEHDFIERLCAVLSKLVDAARRKEPVSREALQRIIALFRERVDLVHHEKEETVLFDELGRAGVNWTSDAMTRIRTEHQQERYLIRSLRHSALQQEEWTESDRQSFVSIGAELLELQHRHLEQEQAHLFPLARDRLPAGRVDAVLLDFEKLERQGMDCAVAASTLEALERQYLN